MVRDDATEVFVPPHVLSTPIICDLERDGHDEIVVGVSYFYSAAQSLQHTLFGTRGDEGTSQVAVAGLVAFDLETRKLKVSKNVFYQTIFRCVFVNSNKRFVVLFFAVYSGKVNWESVKPKIALWCTHHPLLPIWMEMVRWKSL
jgi:hypothetical protein